MNLANKITLFRIFLIPIFPLVFFSSLEHRLSLSLIVFFIAGISDVLDGYIARNYNMITPMGTVLDPLADKCMVLTVVGCFVYANLLPKWLLLLYVIKEGIQIIIGTYFYFNKYKIHIPSNKFGKFGTASLYALIIGVGLNIPVVIEKILLTIALILALLAFISYGKALIFEVKEESE